jgi:hypothetical protein
MRAIYHWANFSFRERVLPNSLAVSCAPDPVGCGAKPEQSGYLFFQRAIRTRNDGERLQVFSDGGIVLQLDAKPLHFIKFALRAAFGSEARQRSL